ncbi:MAG: PTS sugar transporter subunit IIA [Kiritimatiellae bacterium]|nr:PTS sugar transporter subunit IIA [Kiritimatiellia bacterium]
MNEEVKDLPEILENTIFIPALKATTKDGVLAELADVLVEQGAISKESRNAIFAALKEREEKMSTGMQYGIAIPHAKSDLVSCLITMIAISPNGIDFDSLDGDLSTIFVATLSPTADTNSHIKFLAEVSRNLSSKKIREKLLEAKNLQEMKEAICG